LKAQNRKLRSFRGGEKLLGGGRRRAYEAKQIAVKSGNATLRSNSLHKTELEGLDDRNCRPGATKKLGVG